MRVIIPIKTSYSVLDIHETSMAVTKGIQSCTSILYPHIMIYLSSHPQ